MVVRRRGGLCDRASNRRIPLMRLWPRDSRCSPGSTNNGPRRRPSTASTVVGPDQGIASYSRISAAFSSAWPRPRRSRSRMWTVCHPVTAVELDSTACAGPSTRARWPETVVEFVTEGGGFLTVQDLAEFRAEVAPHQSLLSGPRPTSRYIRPHRSGHRAPRSSKRLRSSGNSTWISSDTTQPHTCTTSSKQ